MLLARSLGMDVIAEGVETAEQRERLLAVGCGLAQGYFFSRPVEGTRAEEFIRGDCPWHEA